MATDSLDYFVKRMSSSDVVVIVGVPEEYVDLDDETRTSSGYNEPQGDDEDAISHWEVE